MTLLLRFLTVVTSALLPTLSLCFTTPTLSQQRRTIQSSNSQLYQRKETKSFKLTSPEIFRSTPLNNVVEDVMEKNLVSAVDYEDVLRTSNKNTKGDLDETTDDSSRTFYKNKKEEDDKDNNAHHPVIMKEMQNIDALESPEKKKSTTTTTTTTATVAPPMKMSDAVSIIAGTAIGGGFLALPSVTNPIGYLPSVLGLVLIWSYLVLSSTAFVEAAGLVVVQSQQQQHNEATTVKMMHSSSSMEAEEHL
mmetsp:Transcript_505/g.756  ORF Transcript_505/g.756 Transcript_505/m.756 type:complete len:249 (+) Transcript_505:78-824(+)